MAASRADVREADEWWASLTDDKRVSTHRWLSGKGKMPPPEQPEVLFDLDGSPVEEAVPEEASG